MDTKNILNIDKEAKTDTKTLKLVSDLELTDGNHKRESTKDTLSKKDDLKMNNKESEKKDNITFIKDSDNDTKSSIDNPNLHHYYEDTNNDTKASKKRKYPTFNLAEMFILIIITGIISSMASGIIMRRKISTSNGTAYADLLQDENIKEFLDVYATISDDYYEDIDKNKAIDGAISGMMEYVGDKYSSYLDENTSTNLTSSLSGTYFGIGVSLSGEEAGLIVNVANNTPAYEVGLQNGDKIIAVNGEEVTSSNNSQISSLIKEGKTVTLTIKRGDETFDTSVTARDIISPSISYGIIENTSVGYIYIKSFTKTLGTQIEEALKDLNEKGMTNLIIDLRYNTGGLLSSLQDVAELFVEKNKVIYKLETKDNTSEYKDTTSAMVTTPITVLINGATASASEMLALTLKENNGATIVGTTSYGKGKVQHSQTLSNGSSYKYTVAKWLSPNGNCIDEVGITPDYEVEMEYIYDSDGNITGYTDTQFNKAMELITNGTWTSNQTVHNIESSTSEVEKNNTSEGNSNVDTNGNTTEDVNLDNNSEVNSDENATN